MAKPRVDSEEVFSDTDDHKRKPKHHHGTSKGKRNHANRRSIYLLPRQNTFSEEKLTPKGTEEGGVFPKNRKGNDGESVSILGYLAPHNRADTVRNLNQKMAIPSTPSSLAIGVIPTPPPLGDGSCEGGREDGGKTGESLSIMEYLTHN